MDLEELGEALLPAGEPFGFVDYAALADEAGEAASALARNLERVASADLGRLEGAERKCFLLNAYNVVSLAAAAARLRKNPRWAGNTSWFGRVRFFALSRHAVGGRRVSLHALENKIIRRECEGDARVHAYLNCCSVGCPRLSRRWLTPDNLERVLDEASASFVGPQGGARPREGGAAGLSVSSIFKWYAGDFEAARPRRDADAPDGVYQFVEAHRAGAEPALPPPPGGAGGGGYYEYQAYDWRPNDAALARELGLL